MNDDLMNENLMIKRSKELDKETEERLLKIINSPENKISIEKQREQLKKKIEHQIEDEKNKKPQKYVKVPLVTENISKHWDKKFKKNFLTYYNERENIYEKYKGLWIGFDNNKIIATGNDMIDAYTNSIYNGSKFAYIVHVGFEDEETTQNISITYDNNYDKRM